MISLLKDIGSYGITEKRNLKAAFFRCFPATIASTCGRALISTSNAGDLLSAYVSIPATRIQWTIFKIACTGLRLQPLHQPREGPPPRHLRTNCRRQDFFVIKDILSHLIVNPMVWVVDFPTPTATFRILARGDALRDRHHAGLTTGHQFPLQSVPVRRPGAIPDEQFDFCMGFLKLMAGPQL